MFCKNFILLMPVDQFDDVQEDKYGTTRLNEVLSKLISVTKKRS